MGHATRVPDSWFWVEPAAVVGDLLRLDPEESRHLLRVFRAVPGTRFEATDGRGNLYGCVLQGTEGDVAEARIETRATGAGELSVRIDLIVGLPDLEQAEAIVEHASALGVARIDFAAAARSGPERLNPARLARLQRIGRAAVKQSRRTVLPELRAAGTFREALDGIVAPRFRYAAEGSGTTLPPSVREEPQAQVTLAVGPPGGFVDDERALLRDHEFQWISLGPNRLSTSTAAICFVASVRNSFLVNSLT